MLLRRLDRKRHPTHEGHCEGDVWPVSTRGRMGRPDTVRLCMQPTESEQAIFPIRSRLAAMLALANCSERKRHGPDSKESATCAPCR